MSIARWVQVHQKIFGMAESFTMKLLGAKTLYIVTKTISGNGKEALTVNFRHNCVNKL